MKSILYSGLKALIISLLTILGIGMGILFISAVIIGMATDDEETLEVKHYFSPTIVANQEGIRKKEKNTAPVILKININGIIGDEKLNMHTMRQQLIESREGILKNNRVKAILLHINSPGGTVFDADGIYRALIDYKREYHTPIYAFVDGICASGGVYIASAADQIYATEASIVGSVGVLSPSFFNVSTLMKTIGVENKTLFAGKGKEDMNPFRPWKEGEEKSYQELINSFYQQFVDIVTLNRPNLNRDNLINQYGAEVFPAAQAKAYGFIDKKGETLQSTLAALAENIGIDDGYYQVVKMTRKVTLQNLFDKDSPMMTGQLTHRMELPGHFNPQVMGQFLYLYLPQGQ